MRSLTSMVTLTSLLATLPGTALAVGGQYECGDPASFLTEWAQIEAGRAQAGVEACMSHDDVLARCLYEGVDRLSANPPVLLANVSFQLGQGTDDGTTGAIWVSLSGNESDRIYLQTPGGFQPGGYYSFTFAPEGVTQLDDFRDLRLAPSTSDGIRLDDIRVSINHRTVFDTPASYVEWIDERVRVWGPQELNFTDDTYEGATALPNDIDVEKLIKTMVGHELSQASRRESEIEFLRFNDGHRYFDAIEVYAAPVGNGDRVIDRRGDRHTIREGHVVAFVQIHGRGGSDVPYYGGVEGEVWAEATIDLTLDCNETTDILSLNPQVDIEILSTHIDDGFVRFLDAFGGWATDMFESELRDKLATTNLAPSMTIDIGDSLPDDAGAYVDVCPDFLPLGELARLEWPEDLYTAFLYLDVFGAPGELPECYEIPTPPDYSWIADNTDIIDGWTGGVDVPDNMFVLLPDLRVTGIGHLGGNQITITVVNEGAARAGDFYIDAFFGLDAPAQVGDLSDNYQLVRGLEAGQSVTRTFQREGIGWVDVVVDSDERILEADENDNTYARPIWNP